jgi:phytanoyl-CoA hydroxylase
MQSNLTESQWNEFDRLGFVKLGRLEPEQLRKLQDRIDAIMRGEAEIDYDQLLMQLETDNSAYHNLGGQTLGFKGASPNYRKIQNLEIDPDFLEYLRHPLFEAICRRVYGEDVPVAIFRAMFFNKPPNIGSILPWHQDRWSDISPDPQITVWTAMDPATVENGCLKIIPESHRHGLINPTQSSGFLNKAQAALICTPDRTLHLELEPGEVVLLHNYLLHSSDPNRSAQSRRAFSVCYMQACTLKDGQPGNFCPAFQAA